jgi:hypothetical protein
MRGHDHKHLKMMTAQLPETTKSTQNTAGDVQEVKTHGHDRHSAITTTDAAAVAKGNQIGLEVQTTGNDTMIENDSQDLPNSVQNLPPPRTTKTPTQTPTQTTL